MDAYINSIHWIRNVSFLEVNWTTGGARSLTQMEMDHFKTAIKRIVDRYEKLALKGGEKS